MSDSENREILIRALEASGSDREAKLARAILGAPETKPAAAASEEETPVPRSERPLTRDDIPQMSEAEINARWDEVAEVMKQPVAS